MPNSSVVSINRLTKFYGNHMGVFDLNLEVYDGEIFGFLGPNGAGKTTTIRLMLDLIKPNSGNVQIFGLDSRKDSIKIKRDIGYLPGELKLYNNMGGKDFLIYMANLHGGVDWDFVNDMVERLKTDLTRPIGNLSHGNKQKLRLIQAFMHDPSLLILDEPTNGLDPIIQEEFHKILKEIKKEDKTVFLSSHIMGEVEQICDKVGIIRKGQLATLETIESLKKKRFQSIEVHFASIVQKNMFENLPGIFDLEVKGKVLKCKLSSQDNLDSFIKTIAKSEVTKIIAPEPNLEEIFLSYFKGDDIKNKGVNE